MPGRTFQAGSSFYRYSINGQEKTPEIASNTTSAEYWQYDARIVRRWNVDPVPKDYESPYAAFGNSPIWLGDSNGADTTVPTVGGGTATFGGDVYEVDTYQQGTSYNMKGTCISVPAQPGQLRSFKSSLGTFAARWKKNSGGTAEFAGYQNESGEDYNNTVAKHNQQVAGEELLQKINDFFSDPLNQALLIAAPLEIQRASFKNGSSSGINSSVVTKSEIGVAAEAEVKATTTALVPYYPPNGGALGKWYDVTAIKGAKLDRIGGLGGSYLSPYGTPFEMRALPANGTYRAFEVLKPFPMKASITSPWFGQPGLGTQYKTPVSIDDLIYLKFLKPL